MCGSTCFGLLLAHHQEHTTALGASGFTVGGKQLEQSVITGQTTTNNVQGQDKICSHICYKKSTY
jgi:hypothetical protein